MSNTKVVLLCLGTMVGVAFVAKKSKFVASIPGTN